MESNGALFAVSKKRFFPKKVPFHFNDLSNFFHVYFFTFTHAIWSESIAGKHQAAEYGSSHPANTLLFDNVWLEGVEESIAWQQADI